MTCNIRNDMVRSWIVEAGKVNHDCELLGKLPNKKKDSTECWDLMT